MQLCLQRFIVEAPLTEIYHGLPMEKSWNSMEKTWTPCKNDGFSMTILNAGRIHGAYCIRVHGLSINFPWIFHGAIIHVEIHDNPIYTHFMPWSSYMRIRVRWGFHEDTERG